MNIIEMGKELAFLLRHDADARKQGIIDANGWRSIKDLVDNHGFTEDLLKEIVTTDNKGRYEYNSNKTHIRARQGHSINVEVDLTPVTNIEFLFHGTSDRFIDAIKKEGIKKMSRNYVQLSEDVETATTVGKRHGGHLVIIQVNANQMLKDGLNIYISNNGVYLTDYVNPKYFKNVIVCY